MKPPIVADGPLLLQSKTLQRDYLRTLRLLLDRFTMSAWLFASLAIATWQTVKLVKSADATCRLKQQWQI
jgi:hypothetical protein